MKYLMLNIKLFSIHIKKKLNSLYKLIGLEGLVWLTSIVYLFTLSDYDSHHFTICPLSNLGIDFCPGCGLGRSVSMVLHGHFIESFDYHWFGIPATLIILFRIFQVVRDNLNLYFNSKNKGVNHA